MKLNFHIVKKICTKFVHYLFVNKFCHYSKNWIGNENCITFVRTLKSIHIILINTINIYSPTEEKTNFAGGLNLFRSFVQYQNGHQCYLYLPHNCLIMWSRKVKVELKSKEFFLIYKCVHSFRRSFATEREEEQKTKP